MHNTYRDSIFSHSPNSEIELGNRTDFLYPRKTNSLGLSDKEWKVTKDTNTIRIVALGDSFTEGDGAPVDSTWPRFLEQMLVGEALNVEVMNAGVCGSDPFFSISLLKNRLLKYNPDIVIISVSMQDFLEDIAVRGGMDRFDPNNGRLPQFRELLYAYSRIVRLGYTYMGYSWLLINEQSEALLNELTQVKMPELTHEIESIKKAHRNMDVILVLYPHMHQYERGYEEKLEASFKNNIAKAEGVYFVDLMDCYKAEIENSNKDYKSFWWLNDGHHNSDGYLMKATCIKEKVQMTFNAN